MRDVDFDALVERIQGEVFAEARTALGDKGFERWRNPRFCGIMADADSHARLKGSCGDSVEIYLKADRQRVVAAQYVTDGCGASAVAASFTAELAIGKSFAEVLAMTGADVLAEVGVFPREEEHCAHLAVSTLQKALQEYLGARSSSDLSPATQKGDNPRPQQRG